MPVWLIESFGARELQNAFLFIALMTSPVWLLIIFFPGKSATRAVAQPWLMVPVYVGVLFAILWKSYEASLLPVFLVKPDYGGAQELASHPIIFLVLFCNLQIINLFMGVMIYQKAMRSGFRAPIELFLCWMLGAVALVPFGLRLFIRRQVSL